jgi:hypothetical protein
LCSPFLFKFVYGASNEGYWNYDRMVLQLKDCVDVLKCLYPQYDFLFLFDHSCGHHKQQPNGLNAENMLESYGGQQSILRSTVIKEENGYLGPHSYTLKPGDEQLFTFQENDSGSFWMTERMRSEKKEDKVVEGAKKVKKFTKAELTEKLRQRGLLTSGTYKKIKEICMQNNIKTQEEIQKVIPGWGGKQKGLL